MPLTKTVTLTLRVNEPLQETLRQETLMQKIFQKVGRVSTNRPRAGCSAASRNDIQNITGCYQTL